MNIIFKQTSSGARLLALLLVFVVFFIIGTGMVFVPASFGCDVAGLSSQAVSQIVTFGGSSLFFCYLFHGNPLQYMQFVRQGKAMKTFFSVLIVLLLVLPMSDWLSTVNDRWHFPQALAGLEHLLRQIGEQSKSLLDGYLLRGGVGDLIANLLVLAVVPAFCEELFFRGALQQTMVCCFGGKHHLAIWITAAVFSLMHGEVFAFLPRFLLGLLLGYLYYYGRTIWVNIAAHFLNNASVVVLYFLAARGVIDLGMAESLGLPFVVVLATFAASILFFVYCFVSEKNSV